MATRQVETLIKNPAVLTDGGDVIAWIDAAVDAGRWCTFCAENDEDEDAVRSEEDIGRLLQAGRGVCLSGFIEEEDTVGPMDYANALEIVIRRMQTAARTALPGATEANNVEVERLRRVKDKFVRREQHLRAESQRASAEEVDRLSTLLGCAIDTQSEGPGCRPLEDHEPRQSLSASDKSSSEPAPSDAPRREHPPQRPLRCLIAPADEELRSPPGTCSETAQRGSSIVTEASASPHLVQKTLQCLRNCIVLECYYGTPFREEIADVLGVRGFLSNGHSTKTHPAYSSVLVQVMASVSDSELLRLRQLATHPVFGKLLKAFNFLILNRDAEVYPLSNRNFSSNLWSREANATTD